MALVGPGRTQRLAGALIGSTGPMEWLPADDRRLVPSSDLADAVAHLRAADLLPAVEPHRDRVLDFVARHPDVLHRTCLSGHLTGSALVVDPSRGHTLLMLHRKLSRWFQPGGHADGDANLLAVALKEAAEETGISGLMVATPAIDLDVHEVPAPEGDHLHLDLRFLVRAPAGADAPGNHESLELRWVDEAALDGLDPPLDAGTVRLVRRGLGLARSLT